MSGLEFHDVWKSYGAGRNASPALNGNQIFLRGFTNLYCIGKPEP